MRKSISAYLSVASETILQTCFLFRTNLPDYELLRSMSTFSRLYIAPSARSASAAPGNDRGRDGLGAGDSGGEEEE